jgi:hypothetical protein
MLFFSSPWLFLACSDETQANILKTLWNVITAGINGLCANLLPAFRAQGIPILAGRSNGFVMPSLIDHWFTITIILIGFFLINQQGQ